MVQAIPAPSLRELARPTGVTEGVSSDGCSGPTIYTPAHFGSVIFERLRSSGYTPTVSHSLDSSLREGAGNGLCHSSCRSKIATLRAIFIAPTKLRGGYVPPFNVPPGNGGRAGDFHRPYETQKFQPPKNFRFPPGERYRVGQGTHRMGTSPKRN